jgi:hypothetical protein
MRRSQGVFMRASAFVGFIVASLALTPVARAQPPRCETIQDKQARIACFAQAGIPVIECAHPRDADEAAFCHGLLGSSPGNQAPPNQAPPAGGGRDQKMVLHSNLRILNAVPLDHVYNWQKIEADNGAVSAIDLNSFGHQFGPGGVDAAVCPVVENDTCLLATTFLFDCRGHYSDLYGGGRAALADRLSRRRALSWVRWRRSPVITPQGVNYRRAENLALRSLR